MVPLPFVVYPQPMTTGDVMCKRMFDLLKRYGFIDVTAETNEGQIGIDEPPLPPDVTVWALPPQANGRPRDSWAVMWLNRTEPYEMIGYSDHAITCVEDLVAMIENIDDY